MSELMATQTSQSAQWAAFSDRGSVRAVNEDSFVANTSAGVWAVADGMGGHARGDRASQRIAEEICAIEPAADLAASMAETSAAVLRANHAILAESQTYGARMGSTVVCLVLHDGGYGLIWQGDSRCYLLRQGGLRQLTRDHTQVQDLVDRGALSAQEALSHPMSHVLTRAVGVEESMDMDRITGEIEAGDTFLLCSDGLYGTLSLGEIETLLSQYPPHEAATKLVARCLEVGADDNVTALVVQPMPPAHPAADTAPSQEACQ